MRRRALTLGILLIVVSVFIVEQGPQVLAPLAGLAGLSTHYTKESVVLPPTLYSVPAENFIVTSAYLVGGGEFTWSLQVADGRQVAFYAMNEGNFSLWREGRPASPAVASLMATSYNYTLTPGTSGTYYFVFQNQDNSPVTIIFDLNSLQTIVVLSPVVQYAGVEVLILGALLTLFGVRGGRRRAKPAGYSLAAWTCKFCGAKNKVDEAAFCAKCGRAKT